MLNSLMPSGAPVLQSILPLDAVPQRLQTAIAATISKWGYTWSQVTFAGTAVMPAGTRWKLSGSQDIWIFAITVGSLLVGDEIESAGGRGAAVSLSAFSGGYIPVEPYRAQVYEVLGRRGGGEAPEGRPLQNSPMTA